VFTARYALSPYIKQIRFVFKGLILRSIRYSAASILTTLRASRCKIRITAGTRDSSLLQNVQFVPRFLPGGRSDRGVNLTTRLHLVPKLRMSGAIPLFPYIYSWRGQMQLNLFNSPGIRSGTQEKPFFIKWFLLYTEPILKICISYHNSNIVYSCVTAYCLLCHKQDHGCQYWFYEKKNVTTFQEPALQC
jgi:hypothetical protein